MSQTFFLLGLSRIIGEDSQGIGEKKPRVYLFTSLDWVKECVEILLGEIYWDKDLSVLSINATAEEFGGEINGCEVLVGKVIPPSLIEELYLSEEIDETLGLEY